MAMEADLHDGERGSVKRQYRNIGPRTMLKGALEGVKVSAKTLPNALPALTDRRFKFDAAIGKVSKEGMKALQTVVSTLKVPLNRGVIDEIHERLVAVPEKFKSSKWSQKDFLEALHSAGLDQGTALKKSAHEAERGTGERETTHHFGGRPAGRHHPLI